jgi:hypothetical protein
MIVVFRVFWGQARKHAAVQHAVAEEYSLNLWLLRGFA